jgi:glycosyltransferase involved in cell wall biosynthesis
MRVLVLCYEYPPIGGGGGRVAKTIAEKLVQRGHDVRVQTAGMPHLPKLERVNGVAVHRARSFRRHEDRCTVPEMALFLATSFVPTLRQIRAPWPDVVHAHFAVPTGALAYAASLFGDVPYVLTVHLGDVPGGFPDQTDRLFRCLKPLTVPIWRRAAAITAVSGHVRELAMRAYGVPVETIVNGIELPSALAHAVALHTPRQLIFAGRFVSQKNLLLAVEALAQLRDLNWRATFIGDGPLMSEIRGRVQARGLAERISLPGWQDSASVERAMAESDLFLIPSSAEGLPMAAVQALRHGLAIVGTDIGGLHDVIVDEHNGFRVPVGDVDALAARLRALLEDDAMLLKMRAASWEHARLFDLDAITTQYENVLSRAATRRSSKPTDHAN